MRRWLITFLPVLFFVVGCGNNSSPVGPGGNSSTTGGATIKGSIVGSQSTSAGARTSASTLASTGQATLTVSVVGTSLTTSISGNQFTLQGVPAGNLRLRFNGSAIDSEVELDDVQTTETIDMTVSLDNSTAIIESQRRSVPGGVEIEGRVESLPPTTATGTFVVAGQTVTTASDTAFFLNGSSSSFSELQIGMRVHVKGTLSGTTVAAAIVNIQNTNTSLPVNVNGVIQNLTGTISAFQFTIDGRLIKGTSATEFFGGSSFSSLANGRTAEVKGLQADGFVAAQRIHVNVEDAEQVEIEGVIASKSTSVGVVTLTVGTTTVRADASTDVQRKGDKQDASTLQIGMTVQVVGWLQPDGSINATKIHIKDDQAGATFEIEGSIGGLSGACPTLRFSVMGYAITTDASTTFTPSCGALKSGTKVTIKGTVQNSGSVLASEVTKQ